MWRKYVANRCVFTTADASLGAVGGDDGATLKGHVGRARAATLLALGRNAEGADVLEATVAAEQGLASGEDDARERTAQALQARGFDPHSPFFVFGGSAYRI